jgi:hypothetical protein
MTRLPPAPQAPRPVHAPDRPADGEPRVRVPTRLLSDRCGDDRGAPIDRHDLEGFLHAHPVTVQGSGSRRARVGTVLGEAAEEVLSATLDHAAPAFPLVARAVAHRPARP